MYIVYKFILKTIYTHETRGIFKSNTVSFLTLVYIIEYYLSNFHKTIYLIYPKFNFVL